MSKRALLLLCAGAIILFTVLLLRSRLSEPPVAVAPAEPAAARIVVARRDLAVGSFVQGSQDLDWGVPPGPKAQVIANPLPPDQQPPVAENAEAGSAVPADAPGETYLYEGSVKLTDFNGAIVRRALRAGDPVPQFALMKSGEGGFMAAVLEPGMRAVSISVNPTSGNAGFISPGDRVDLIVTHRVKEPQENNAAATEEFVASETFVRNARVIAVDQMTENPENKAILAKTITVEVTPRNAEAVAVAADLGKISLSLRSLASPDSKLAESETPAERKEAPPAEEPSASGPAAVAAPADAAVSGANYTRDSDISALLVNRKAAAGARVRIVHGDRSENVDFQDKK